MTPAPTPNKTEKKASSLATLLAYIQRQGRLLALVTLYLFLGLYLFLCWIFRDKKIVERLFAYTQRQWRPLALVVLYIFFRSTFEDRVASLLESFDPSLGSFVIWLLLIVIALVYTYILSRRRYVLSEGLRAWTIVMFTGWAYYRFVGTTHYVATPTLIPSTCYMDLFLILCVCVAFIAGRSHWMRRKSKKEVADTSRAGYHVEHPRRSGDKDLLGRLEEAEALAEKIFQTNTSRGAFTLGLTSPWGAGKTSFMLVMKEYLERQHDEKIVVLEFNPWRYRKAPNLTQIFFEELSRALAPYNSALSSGFVRYVDHLLAKDSNPWLQLVSRLLPQDPNAKSTGEQYDFLTREISKLGRKIFIFIDDVDRLEREELVELFALVRNSSSFPYMSYILAYDKEYVASQLKGCFDQHTYRYMEKILQEEYALAQITPEQLERALRMELESIGYGDLFIAIKKSEILLNHHFPTIRAVKRICNTLSSCRKVLEGNVILFDWFVIELLRTQYSCLFDFLRENYSRIFVLQDDRYVMKVADFKETKSNRFGLVLRDHPKLGVAIDFGTYLLEHQESLQIKNVGLVFELMHLLWGESRKDGPLRANHKDYIARYFYGTLPESEIDEEEFHEHMALPFEKMKPYIQKKLKSQGWDLFSKVKRERIDGKLKGIKMLLVAFYIDSQPRRMFGGEEINSFVDILGGYLDVSLLKSSLENVFRCPDVRLGVLRYICPISNKNGSIIIPFTQEEIESIKESLFLEYVEETNAVDPIYCYQLWRLCQSYIEVGPQGWRMPRQNPVVCHPKMDEVMKKIIEDNIELIIPSFVQQYRSDEPKYELIFPNPIWTLEESKKTPVIGYFPSFIFGLDGEASPVIREFQEFLRKRLDSKENVIPFDFKYITPFNVRWKAL